MNASLTSIKKGQCIDMILRYKLQENIERKIELEGDERIYYAVPVDIDENGSWTDDSFLVVTTQKIYIFRGDDEEKYNIKDMSEVSAEPGIGGGILTVRHKGTDKILVHYSSKHLSRYAYVARGISILISGRFEEVESNEYEKICPVCGHVIPGTKHCPKCSKEGGFLSVFMKMGRPYKKEFAGIFLLMVLVAVTNSSANVLWEESSLLILFVTGLRTIRSKDSVST